MKRQIAAWTIAVVALLGITGCSGAPGAESSSGQATVDESSAPVERDFAQSVADACASVRTQVSGVASELSGLDMSAAMADPEGTVTKITETVDAFAAATESIGNQEVGNAVSALRTDLASLRDLLKRVLVDKDASAAAEVTSLSSDVQESMQVLATLCAG